MKHEKNDRIRRQARPCYVVFPDPPRAFRHLAPKSQAIDTSAARQLFAKLGIGDVDDGVLQIVNGLSSTCDSLRQERDALQLKLAQRDSKIVELLEDTAKQIDRAEKAEAKVAQQKEEITKWKGDIQHLVNEVNNLREKLAQQNAEIAKLDGEVQHLLDTCVPVHELTEAREQVAALEKMKVHCEYCGADYLATGLEAGCPCLLVKQVTAFQAEIERLKIRTHLTGRKESAWIDNADIDDGA